MSTKHARSAQCVFQGCLRTTHRWVAYFDELRTSGQDAIYEREVKERADGLAQCKVRMAKLAAR